MTNAKPKVRFVMKPREQSREFPFSDSDFATLSDLIHMRTGIIMKEHKKNMVYSRLARRLRALNIQSFSDYLHYLAGSKGDQEIGYLINAITTNLTKFFRENHHFEHLENQVFPEAIHNIKAGRQKRIRVWSAGCSSGEEPYSISMVLDKALKQHNAKDIDAKILATDLDTNMLDFGRNGHYKKNSVESLDEEYLRYFREGEGQPETYQISNRLRRYISFKQLNLIGKWPVKGPFDAIFCRNVMIYFDNKTKMEITRKFADLLRPGGWLFIGHSETILDTDGRLDLYGRTVYQRVN
ncbi:CheR family methyltransferase [Candidatus Terasakiella magnetica]|uniref:CheR family methyltransferase n=1 Tax=Candidatus Terasakiella magnetica TaxID=1867952 RepID=UPI00196A0DA6|nr:protein-glutamate O-methyltransferase [Candidatus Terasakiella magnetica]